MTHSFAWPGRRIAGLACALAAAGLPLAVSAALVAGPGGTAEQGRRVVVA
jgi:hypothetical protein